MGRFLGALALIALAVIGGVALAAANMLVIGALFLLALIGWGMS